MGSDLSFNHHVLHLLVAATPDIFLPTVVEWLSIVYGIVTSHSDPLFILPDFHSIRFVGERLHGSQKWFASLHHRMVSCKVVIHLSTRPIWLLY
ncbi:hypothetical protein F9C07_1158 [Aspergillus flavus]|uniref:Uncharacterized protein n=1 Tax=Aspergillus flavus (strain ATCC 200026 / FGSC A1120 / IAM 13836 / NRRL 3357 / JCM 12722 / SRRC 167) TaxID=332952 RepID=A0A7U2QZ33_ASPFN|nr:hypothetical protein F9C07_1158 [Aspergillus flavus]